MCLYFKMSSPFFRIPIGIRIHIYVINLNRDLNEQQFIWMQVKFT